MQINYFFFHTSDNFNCLLFVFNKVCACISFAKHASFAMRFSLSSSSSDDEELSLESVAAAAKGIDRQNSFMFRLLTDADIIWGSRSEDSRRRCTVWSFTVSGLWAVRTERSCFCYHSLAIFVYHWPLSSISQNGAEMTLHYRCNHTSE